MDIVEKIDNQLNEAKMPKAEEDFIRWLDRTSGSMLSNIEYHMDNKEDYYGSQIAQLEETIKKATVLKGKLEKKLTKIKK